jgi:hypothetical protein
MVNVGIERSIISADETFMVRTPVDLKCAWHKTTRFLLSRRCMTYFCIEVGKRVSEIVVAKTKGIRLIG